MFLIFYLLRPDVLPLDDIGLQHAVAHHYNDAEPLSREEIREIAEAWRRGYGRHLVFVAQPRPVAVE